MANIEIKDLLTTVPTTDDLVLLSQNGITKNAKVSDIRSVVDDVIHTNTDKSLSANQGKILNDKVIENSNEVGELKENVDKINESLSDMAINVKGLGYLAYGDGIHDDTLAIQSAINSVFKTNSYLSSSGKEKSITIPSGVYNISEPLIIDGSEIEIIGEAKYYAKPYSTKSFHFQVHRPSRHYDSLQQQ